MNERTHENAVIVTPLIDPAAHRRQMWRIFSMCIGSAEFLSLSADERMELCKAFQSNQELTSMVLPATDA